LGLYVFGCVDPTDSRAYAKLAGFVGVLAVAGLALLHLGAAFAGDPGGHFRPVSYAFQGPGGFFAVAHDTNRTAARDYFPDPAFVLAGYLGVATALRARGWALGWRGRAALVPFFVAIGLASYLSPLVMRFSEYSWNNFCKFNYVGIIIGMLCFACLLGDL